MYVVSSYLLFKSPCTIVPFITSIRIYCIYIITYCYLRSGPDHKLLPLPGVQICLG
jgi:hypothetical protein